MDDDLIRSIIAGVVCDPPWQDFIHRLRAEFRASHSNVIFRRSDLTETFITLSSSPEVEEFGDLTARHVPTDDPIDYYEMEAFHPYTVEEFIKGAAGEHPFISRFLGPLGMAHLLICKVVAEPGMRAWISITRAEEPFCSAERSELKRIAHLFGEALHVFGRVKHTEDQRDAYLRVVRARAAGLIQVDQHGAILHLDTTAREWIEEGRFLRSTEGRLRATRTEDRQLFEIALSHILDGTSEEEYLVLQGGDECLEILIYAANEPFEPAWTLAPRATIYMGMVGREAPPSQQRLMTLFELTKREAALAALLGRGRTLNEASAGLGISEQTGRAYLRQIFQKTGVTRQADLVRRIQGSIAGIA